MTRNDKLFYVILLVVSLPICIFLAVSVYEKLHRDFYNVRPKPKTPEFTIDEASWKMPFSEELSDGRKIEVWIDKSDRLRRVRILEPGWKEDEEKR